MLSRNILRQTVARPMASRMLVRNSHGAMPAGFGIAKGFDVEQKVKEVTEQVKSEKLTGDAYEARLKELLAHHNLSLYHGNKEAGQEYISTYEHTKAHGNETASLWKKISIFVFVPALVLASINSYFVEAEHAEHRKHAVESGEKEIPYPYRKLVIKDYFWGDGQKTLFWNDECNHVKEN